ncbi:polypeptide N-acetylgalactosaminyltransferase 3-like [Physella acuta]|uniref:polypeptide N-acetylgalactosaminyltransferase 3-like n=1 Tax=Physella acuta TaxID=109671 RepID=UPI0027DB1B27|nr:polypeptide N-acetylgalactosaminyltransferase 3-like [Physella acuta]
MVGTGFAIDRTYFKEIGEYDSDMQIWGGENLELSWRVWLCGGRLLHAPCSRIGHVPRVQPYSFPGGRPSVLFHNYKRAASVWMGNYTRFVYSIFPEMQTLDVGDLSERLALKTKLGCKDFSWYLQNIWPELNVYDENVIVWGQVKNVAESLCLDNNGHLFQQRQDLFLNRCKGSINMQGFSLTSHGLLRTTLQCAVGHESNITSYVQIEDCIIGSRDIWSYTQNQRLVHVRSGLCLDIDQRRPVLRGCHSNINTQEWTFQPYIFT